MAKLNIQLTKQQQQAIGLGALIVFGGGFAYIKYFWLPTSKKIQDTQKQITETEGKINKAKSQAVRLPKIQKEIETLNEQAAEAEKRLPKARDLPAVITAISVLARKNSVELRSFAPAGMTNRPYFIEVPYSISVRGRFHDIGRFLAAIALEERIYNVRSVVYTPESEGRMSVNFTLISYKQL
ncbi:MAG: type 4a pilus biogenesis protein PilO [Elusimicrobia bacterium]|nr:type 4a pilus biogenesis protein PilO [Elusimicrobiota bacterium]